jgi:hypothetical protein
MHSVLLPAAPKKKKGRKRKKRKNPVGTDSLTIYKWAAIIAVGLYLYKASQANGGTLSGNTMGINEESIRANGDKVIDSVTPWLGIRNPIVHEVVKLGAKHIMRRV